MVDRKSGEGNSKENKTWLPQEIQSSEARNLSGFTRFIYSPSFRLALSIAVAAGYTISQLPFLQKNHVQAAGPARSDDPITFYYNGINREWQILHGTFASSGSGRGIDKNEDFYDGVYHSFFQPMESADCYPEISLGIGVKIFLISHAARPDRGKGLIQTGIAGIIAGKSRPKGGEIVSLANPGDLSQRICLTSEGLPEETEGSNLYDPLVWGTNASGDYLEQGIGNAVDPTKNGKYQLRLDTLSRPIGKWIKQARTVYYDYLPVVLRGFPQ